MSMSSSEFLYLDSVSSTVLFESMVKKLPRRSIGLSRYRYLILFMKKKGTFSISYYENEFAYSSEQPPLGSFNLRHFSPVEGGFSRITQTYYVKLGHLGQEDFIIFALETESLQKAWIEEIKRALGYLKQRRKSRSGTNAGATPRDIEIEVPGIETSTITTESTTESDDEDMEDMEEMMDGMNLNEMQGMLDEVDNEIDNTGETGTVDDDGPAVSASGEDGEAARTSRSSSHDRCKSLDLAITKATSSKARRKATKKKKLIMKKCKINQQWARMAMKWTLTRHARNGNLAACKRFCETYEASDWKGGFLEESLKDTLGNCARSACRCKHKKLLKWLVQEKGIDINLQNVMGFPLFYFAMAAFGDEDGGDMLRYMQEELDCDLTMTNHFGQNALFGATTNQTSGVMYMEYFIDVVGLDPFIVDKFNCGLIHFAVLYNNMPVIEFLFNRQVFNFSRAKWGKSLELIDQIGILPPAVNQARRGWRTRGLVRWANQASPLAVAVLHNNGRIARYLMGFGSNNCVCPRRKQLFENECSDLEMVSIAWPDLVPEMLASYHHDGGEEFFGSSSDASSGGYVISNFAIKDWMGKPGSPMSKTPLGILTKTKSPEIFDTPLIKLVVDLKWETYGRKMYIIQKFPYLLVSFSFWFGHMCDWQAVKYVSAGLSAFLLLKEELLELVIEGPSDYFSSVWNWMSFPSYLMTIALGLNDMTSGALGLNDEQTQILVSAAGFLFVFRSLEFLSILGTTSLYVVTIRMLLLDIAKWATLFVLFIFGYASAFRFLLWDEEGHETFGESIVTVFRMSIGDFDYPFTANVTIDKCATVLWISYTFLVHLLYLNVLIAMMSKSFEGIENAASGMSCLALASSLVTWENTIPGFKRKEALERVCRDGKPVTMTLTDGLGLDLATLLLSSKGEAGSGARQIMVEDGLCTIFAKNDKTWKEIEEEEAAERAKKLDVQMVSMLQMISTMGEEMGGKMDKLERKMSKGDGGAVEGEEGERGIGTSADGDGDEEEKERTSLSVIMERHKKKEGKRKKLLKFMRGKF